MSEHENDPNPDPRLDELADLLDRVAAEEESVAREAERLTDAPGLESVGEILERSWSGEESRGGRMPPRLVAAAAGVAILFALWFVFAGDPRSADSGTGPGGVHLSEGDFTILVPGEQEAQWTAIEWDGPVETHYAGTVRDARNGEVLLPLPRTMEHRVDLDPELTRKWPDEIYIELEMREKDGTLRSTSITSRRSP